MQRFVDFDDGLERLAKQALFVVLQFTSSTVLRLRQLSFTRTLAVV
jgi:hypothetical protein